VSDFNFQKNRVVWVDIAVADLSRSITFYEAVLSCKVHREKFGDWEFGVIDHQDGNGGCLIVDPEKVCEKGFLVYLNAEGRIRDAVAKAKANGGTVLKDVESIGPHGFRAIIKDSEGNRLALHSNSDK